MSLILRALWAFPLTFSAACFKNQGLLQERPEALRYPIKGEPPTLDWSLSVDRASSLIIQNIMEGLSQYDFQEGTKVKGALAESWTSSEDQKRWVFKLRAAQWHDFKPVRASHFTDSFERLLNPKTGSEYAYFLFPVKNARAYNSGEIKDFAKVGFKAFDEKGELHVELSQGLSYLPYLFTHPCAFPIRKDLLKKGWTEAGSLIGTGPYSLKRWEHDKALVLKAAPSYYGKPPKIKEVILPIIPEETTALNLFFSGFLDAAPYIPSRDLPRLRKKKEYRSKGTLSIYYYGFQVSMPPLNDVRVRKALSMAIDREELALVLNGKFSPLSFWLPPELRGAARHRGAAHTAAHASAQAQRAYGAAPSNKRRRAIKQAPPRPQTSSALKFDPAAANRLLDEAGFQDRSLLPSIAVSYNSSQDNKTAAENIQAQWKKRLNVQAHLQSQEWKTYLRSLSLKKTPVFRLGWLADYPDPHNFMNVMSSFSENNHTGWKSEKFDRWILKASAMPQGAKRQALYSQAENLLLEEAPVLPLLSGKSHALISDRLKKHSLNTMESVLFKNMELQN